MLQVYYKSAVLFYYVIILINISAIIKPTKSVSTSYLTLNDRQTEQKFQNLIFSENEYRRSESLTFDLNNHGTYHNRRRILPKSIFFPVTAKPIECPEGYTFHINGNGTCVPIIKPSILNWNSLLSHLNSIYDSVLSTTTKIIRPKDNKNVKRNDPVYITIPIDNQISETITTTTEKPTEITNLPQTAEETRISTTDEFTDLTTTKDQSNTNADNEKISTVEEPWSTDVEIIEVYTASTTDSNPDSTITTITITTNSQND